MKNNKFINDSISYEQLSEKEQIDLLLIDLGLVFFISQSIEYNMVTFFSLSQVGDYKGTEDEFRDLMNSFYQNTMGKTKKILTAKLSISSELKMKLELCIEARNWLAHNFYREYGLASISEEIRYKAREKLKKAKCLFEETNELLSFEIENICNIHGMSSLEIENKNKEHLDKYYQDEKEPSEFWDIKLSKPNWR